ncbi:MAG: hypothetical protein ACM3TT_11925 [Syntrophothermus sp.]
MLAITCAVDCIHQIEGICWLDEIYSCLSAQAADEDCVYYEPASDVRMPHEPAPYEPA